jgi:hypothetical protein
MKSRLNSKLRDYRAVAQRFDGDVWVWAWIGSHKDFDRQFRV